jgi:hypothetical protein
VTKEPPKAYLGEWLTLKVSGLAGLSKNTKPDKPLQLYLNGMPLVGSKPFFIRENGETDKVRFELARTDASKDLWSALLGRPGSWSDDTIDTLVSVGVADCKADCADMTNTQPIRLVAIRGGWFAGFVIAFLLFVGALVWLAKKKAILRDRGATSPWSLARTQMAWWSVVVVGSFVFIWMVTGDASSLTDSVLALIGVSAGTAVFGAVLDNTKENQEAQRQALVAEKALILGGAPPANPNRLQEIDAQLQALPPVWKKPLAAGFWQDILSDENGLSFHRFQMVIWTLVLTTIFVVRVYATLSMPDFNAQLLGLTGISASTYLGFKFSEKAY